MPKTTQPPEIPIVHGELISLPPDVDETRGVPADVAERVSAQLLQALGERMINPTTVVFSGYDDYENENHARKAETDGLGDPDLAERLSIDSPPPEGTYDYFFLGAKTLASGVDGPFAFAASGSEPVVGVYDLERLRAIGYDEVHGSVTTTPDELRGTMVMEFRPAYERPDGY